MGKFLRKKKNKIKVIQQTTSDEFIIVQASLNRLQIWYPTVKEGRYYIKKKLAVPRTNIYRHLDHFTSIRAGGDYAKVMAYLGVSIAQLFTLFKRIKDLHLSELTVDNSKKWGDEPVGAFLKKLSPKSPIKSFL